MGSFTKLTYHIVFATKYRRKTIDETLRERLYEYIGGIIRAKKGVLVEIGGVTDHVHILAQLTPKFAVADAVRDIKSNSSGWMHEHSIAKSAFQGQIGYGAFTVSYSHIEVVQDYIRNQEQHHRSVSFQEEYEHVLKRHNISFRPEYLFEDEHHG